MYDGYNKSTGIEDMYMIYFKDGVGVEHILNGLYTIDMAAKKIEYLKTKFPGYNDFKVKKHEY